MVRFDSRELGCMNFEVQIQFMNSADSGIRIEQYMNDRIGFLFLMEGSARHIVNGKSNNIKKGQLTVLLSGQIHKILCSEEDNAKAAILTFSDFSSPQEEKPGYQSKYLAAFMGMNGPLIPMTEIQAGEVREVMTALEEEVSCRTKGSRYRIRERIYKFLAYLEREGLMDMECFFAPEKEGSNMTGIIQHIEENFFEDVNLTKIAEQLNMNYFYTSRYFKKLTGRNFKQFLNYVRVSEINRMLMESSMSMAEISDACGFSCQQAMNRTYKTMVGESPLKMRHLMKRG